MFARCELWAIASLASTAVGSALPRGVAADVPAPEQISLAPSNIEKSYGLPVQAVPYFNDATLHYNTYIGIGSPVSQLFTAAIDLVWADSWVVSVACNERLCRHHLRYNASQSETFEGDGTPMHLGFPMWPELDGTVFRDTVSLGNGIEVEHQPLVELLHWGGPYGHEFDAVLGLSPSITKWQDENSTQPHLPSPFTRLAKSGKLERNVFSLLAPYNRTTIGDLSFGTVHTDLSDGPLVSHPIFPPDAPFWQIKAPTVSMRHQNGSAIFTHAYAANVSAQLDSISNDILLSRDVATRILASVHANISRDCYVMAVPCDKVAELPELVLDFDGQEIVLKGEDYMVEAEWPLCFRGPYCTLMVGPLPSSFDQDTIILGTEFLKKVYAVFDWDEKSVSFGKANHRFDMPARNGIVPRGVDTTALKHQDRVAAERRAAISSVEEVFPFRRRN